MIDTHHRCHADFVASTYTHAQGGSDPLLAIPGRDVCSSQNGGLMRLLYMTEPSRQDFLCRSDVQMITDVRQKSLFASEQVPTGTHPIVVIRSVRTAVDPDARIPLPDRLIRGFRRPPHTLGSSMNSQTKSHAAPRRHGRPSPVDSGTRRGDERRLRPVGTAWVPGSARNQ